MDNYGTHCPGGRYCDCAKCNDRSEFQKLLELKDGVVIYRHYERQVMHDDATEINMPKPSRPLAMEYSKSATEEIRADDNIVIIIHNTENKTANAASFLHELDINKVSCPRCREILKRAKAMLEKISAVQNNETIGSCDLCRLKERLRAPCKYCQKSIEKFKSYKPLTTSKEDHLKKKLDSIFKSTKTNVIIMKGLEKRRSYSDFDIPDTFGQKITESFDQSLIRPKSGMTFYSKAQSMRDKICTRLLQKQTETKKIITDVKTQVDFKRLVPDQQAPMKKSPYLSGFVLGIGTTGIMPRSHSDESLITSFSGLTQEMFKKNFKYFFPGGIKKKETIVKTSEELIKDTRDRFQAEADQELKKEEQRMLIKLERQREKETAIEEINRKTEWARRERLSDIDFSTGKIMQNIKNVESGMEKGNSIVTKKSKEKGKEIKEKLDKQMYEPIEKEKSVRDKERLVSVRDIVKTERKLKEKDDRVDKVKEERKENEKPAKAEKLGKQPDTIKTERKAKGEDRVDKLKEERKENEKPAKAEKLGKQLDTIKTERKAKGEDKVDKSKEERKENEKPAKAEKLGKQSDIIKTERKAKEEDRVDKLKDERKEKEKPEKVEKFSKSPDTVKTERKPKEKEEQKDKIKQELQEKGKSDRISKVSKEPDLVKDGRKTKEIKDTKKTVQQAKEKVDAKKGVKEIDNKKQEKKEQGGKEIEDVQVKKEIGKDKDTKPPIRPNTEKRQEKSNSLAGKKKSLDETKIESKSKVPRKKDTTLLEKDASLKYLKFDKTNKKSVKESAIQDKDKTTGKSKGTHSKAEDKLLNDTLKKQDNMKLDAMKEKQSRDTKYDKDMQKADALLTKLSKEPNMNLEAQNKANKKEGGEKMEGEKGKPSKKSIELGLKEVKYEPSGDDLILRLVKTSKPIKDFKSVLPLQLPLPKPLKIIRRVRRKPSICSLRSELALDAESILRKRMESKKNVKPEIINGGKIYFEKDIPQEPERVKAAIFETAFNDKTIIVKPETEISELEPEKKSDEKGVFRYTLSDRKFIDNGWTILPTQKVLRKMNMYRMHPAKPEFDWFERNKGKGPMAYDSGEKLAEVTDDGRGKWYYKNGRIALDYYESEDLNAQQRVVVYSSGEPDERGRSRPVTVLGMFDHLGSGVVFDHFGKIRLKYNQNEGVILDRELGPVTHWLWHSLNEPPELEQVMIDTQLSFKEPEIIKLGDNDREVRSNDEEMVAIELDNLIKSKITKPTPKFIPHQIRMKALKINNQFSLKVLDQKTIYLLFREGLNTMKLNLGMTLDDTEILDTRKAELHDVSVDIENKPAMTDSVANLQKSLMSVQRLHNARAERELRKRPLSPAASAEQLKAAVSKPLRVSLLAGADPSNNSKCRANNLYYNTRLI